MNNLLLRVSIPIGMIVGVQRALDKEEFCAAHVELVDSRHTA